MLAVVVQQIVSAPAEPLARVLDRFFRRDTPFFFFSVKSRDLNDISARKSVDVAFQNNYIAVGLILRQRRHSELYDLVVGDEYAVMIYASEFNADHISRLAIGGLPLHFSFASI